MRKWKTLHLTFSLDVWVEHRYYEWQTGSTHSFKVIFVLLLLLRWQKRKIKQISEAVKNAVGNKETGRSTGHAVTARLDTWRPDKQSRHVFHRRPVLFWRCNWVCGFYIEFNSKMIEWTYVTLVLFVMSDKKPIKNKMELAGLCSKDRRFLSWRMLPRSKWQYNLGNWRRTSPH